MTPPSISIVTPCLNRREMVAEAVESVLEADLAAEVEHIVVDGGSTDGTLDVLARYGHLRVVHEPGCGLYEALNRGVALARGSIVGFLNTDDTYAPGSLASALAGFEHYQAIDYVAGGAVLFVRENGGPERIVARMTPPGRMLGDDGMPRARLFARALMAPSIINAHFFRRDFLEKIGKFNPRYPIAADREFMLRVILSDAVGGRLASDVYRYRMHAGSLTLDPGTKRRRQTAREHVEMATAFLRDPLASGARRDLQSWRSREAAVRTLAGLREGRWTETWREGWGLCLEDAFWPVRALALVPIELPSVWTRRKALRAL